MDMPSTATDTGGGQDPGAAPARRRRPGPSREQRRITVLVIVAASALVGMTAGVRPTDLLVSDLLVVGGLAALAPWCAAHARRWTWCWAAGVAGVAGVGSVVPLVLALVALGLALASTTARRRRRITGAVVGALAIQALLRLDDVGPLGLTAGLTAVALLPLLVSGYQHMPRRNRRRLFRLGVAVAVVAVVGAASAALVAALVATDLDTAIARSESAVANVGAGEQEATLAELDEASADFGSAADLLGSPFLWPARAVPVVGPHVGALRQLSSTGEELTRTASVTVGEVDYDRLKYESGRINLDVVQSIEPALQDVRGALVEAEARTGEVDSPWLLGPLTDRVDELRTKIIRTRQQADSAEVGLQLAPGMLGADGPRRYLVVFPTESETRGGGGFVGNFVILDAVDGEVRLTESSRIRALINARQPGSRVLEGLDEYVAQYGDLRPQDFNQDILYSPHFPWNAEAFAQVASQSGRGEIDTVISVAPSGLAALMTFTGPVALPGRPEPLQPEDAEQFLQLGQYLEYQDNEERSDALEVLTRQVFDRLTTGTLPSPRSLGAQLSPLVPTGGIKMWSARPEEQDLLRELGVTGEMPPAGGHDLVHVSGVNGGQNKIDVFLHRQVEVEPRYDPATGEIVSTVRVTLRNDSPSEGLPRYVNGNAQADPTGTNRHLLSLFSPLDLVEATVDGVPVGVDLGSERGYQVYSRYVSVPPGGTVVVEYQLRGTIPDMEGYELLVPAQPMVNPDQVVVRGPLVGEDTELDLDRERTVVGASG